MRLIDVDAFLAEITKELSEAPAETESDKDKLRGIGYFINRLTDFPSIETKGENYYVDQQGRYH